MSDPNTPAPTEASQVPGAKTWRVGTLVYTSGGLVALFCVLLFGDFAWAMRERSVGPMSQWYLDSLRVPNVVFGLLLTSFPAFLGLIIGPIISVRSDRHRGPRGRRIPFLLVTTPLAALGMAGIAITPVLAANAHAALAPGAAFGSAVHSLLDGIRAGEWIILQMQNPAVVSVVCFAVFWALFEVGSIMSSAVFFSLINDVVPQAVIGRFFGLFRAVSLVDGILFNYWIMGKVPVHFTVIMLCIAVFYGLAFTWVCLRVKEGSYPPPGPAPVGTALGRVKEGVFSYFRESFKHRYYLFVFVMLTVGQLVSLPFNTFAIPYARSLGIGIDVYGRYLALTFAISFCLSYFLGWLADLFHPLRGAIISVAGYGLVTVWGIFYVHDQSSFLIAWVLHGVLSGCYATCAASLPQRLFPRTRFAQFASAAGVVSSLAHMAVAPILGAVIDFGGGSYHLVFTAGLLLAGCSITLGVIVYRAFIRLGGHGAYLPPE